MPAIINKRPIMSVNFETNIQADYIASQNRLLKLREMLSFNRNAQQSLIKIKKDIEFRKRELEEIGMLTTHSREKNNEMFDPGSAINEVKKLPVILHEQQLIKKNSVHQYGFVRNIMIEEKQTRGKKQKNYRPQQLLISNLSPNPRLICFVAEAERFGKTGIQLYKDWRGVYKKSQKDEKKLMLIDDDKLIQKRKIYGDNWEKIGYFFNGFTFEDLYYYFQKNLNKVQTGKWSLRHNLMLIALVEYYGSGKWAAISKKLKVKSQFQIRQRFCNVLDPKVKQNKWSEQDQKLLLDTAHSMKYKWSKIAKQVPQFANKTDNALRRKFRNLMIKKDNEEIHKLIKNKKLRDSILLFKQNYYNRKKRRVVTQQQELNNDLQ